MAMQSGRGSKLRPYLTLLIFATIFQSGLAQLCSFWDGGCVDPLAQTAVSFGFPPLFLDDINLYYGFDANSRGKGHEPMTKASFWLGYAARRIDNSVIDRNRTSEIAMRIGNLTGTPAGDNNGCDGVWGPQCSNNLKSAFKGAIYDLSKKGDYYSYPLDTVISQMLINPPSLANCPPPFFDVQTFPVQPFGQETDTDLSATLKTSGTSESPWKTWFIDNMTSSQQAEQVAVAIISRGPSYNSAPPRSKDDVQIELVCVQAPSTGSSSTQDT
ncbi:hypothetical protein P170DRAFT_346545 [Aspergillus steynii IBT 23096]|uniref:Uncharacterized protein n=1 Tax=Aspergillus steynii IBT 23096 TaxID=1392250 RepID=A0A2I2GLL2_9EURO|nr:uncharacterized protein P170DRAFT_346545 [Aspergillus steynii IBT 23096]PLB53766.1 hypothetical protein P170DRAFT_346545 [Aspergillus steynii IBT 23096]